MAPQYDFPPGTSQKDPDFGMIRRIITDFRGYDTIEDLRAADEQVRARLAEQLRKTINGMAGVRELLSDRMRLSVMPDFDDMAQQMRKTLERLDRPQSPLVVRCKEYITKQDVIGEIYRLDFQMLTDAENIFNLMQEFQRLLQEDLIRGNIVKIAMAAREISAGMDKKEEQYACMMG
jgi:hypothetical protein